MYALDTNTVIDYLRGNGRVAERLLATPLQEVSLPAVVVYELELGAEKSGASTQRRAQLAKSISVPPRRINEIVHGKRSITADTALRLSRFFGTSERFWLNLQTRYDLETERDRLGDRLNDEVSPLAQAS